MFETRPRVSIGLPVYNGAAFVADAIRSIQSQSLGDFELLVSDNASTDDTSEIVHGLAATDKRIRYLRSDTNVGANRNFNRTYFYSSGEFFKWAAHDDVLEPTYLERCVELLDADPSVVLAHSRTAYIDSNGEPLRPLARGYLGSDGFIERLALDDTVSDALNSIDPAVRFDAVVNRMSVFYDVFGVGRTEAFENTLLLRQYYGADKIFLAEMALCGKIARLGEVLFKRRCHESASTRVADLGQLAEWSDSSGGFAYYPLQMIAGYADAVRASDLPSGVKRRCLTALASKLRSPIGLLRGR
jgi:glycosyltransferase involved in cell wall biosynthesis